MALSSSNTTPDAPFKVCEANTCLDGESANAIAKCIRCLDWQLPPLPRQLFRYVQASELACLPDRSYRCRFPRRAAEAFTSEQNVRRYLRTHRICSPPDYRQLAARGLSPREIHSIVDCSISGLPSSLSADDLPSLFE